MFLEQTKYRFLGRSDQEKGVPQPPLELPTDLTLTVLDLPKPAAIVTPPADLRAAIVCRHSVRSYAK